MMHSIDLYSPWMQRPGWLCSCGARGPKWAGEADSIALRRARRHIAPAIRKSTPRIRLRGGRA